MKTTVATWAAARNASQPVAAAILALAAPNRRAHDIWLDPTPGEIIAVQRFLATRPADETEWFWDDLTVITPTEFKAA